MFYPCFGCGFHVLPCLVLLKELACLVTVCVDEHRWRLPRRNQCGHVVDQDSRQTGTLRYLKLLKGQAFLPLVANVGILRSVQAGTA